MAQRRQSQGSQAVVVARSPHRGNRRASHHQQRESATSWAAFESFGSFAGPPSQPQASNVGSTSLLLHWEAPTHLGGSGFEVVGYQIRVQYGGTGGFNVHVEDSSSDATQHAIDQLSPDTWHEFSVAAITAAGIGAASAASRPVLTERAPRLLRELHAATKQLSGQRAEEQHCHTP